MNSPRKQFNPEITIRIDELAREIASINEVVVDTFSKHIASDVPFDAINDLQKQAAQKKTELTNLLPELFNSLNMAKEWAALTLAIKLMQEWAID